MTKELGPDEKEVIGNWIEVDGEIDGDEACFRIQYLTADYLERIGFSEAQGGWETLFRDPKDGRYWERTYPNGSWHGGGPPALINLSEVEAKEKYPYLFSAIAEKVVMMQPDERDVQED
ncbi:MAG: Imm27 family immunity protein [Pyrinomonadaceae bacterium]